MLAAFLIFVAALLAVLENARVTNPFQNGSLPVGSAESRDNDSQAEIGQFEKAQGRENPDSNNSLNIRERGIQ